MELSPAELTVLGLLVERPRHGYDLEQVIRERGIREWSELGFSSIYYLLAKLQAKGCVESEAGASSRSRRVYAVTPTGRQAAAEGVLAALGRLTPVRPPLLVGLANLPLLSGEQVTAALGARRGQLEERIRSLEATRRAQQPLPPFVDSIFSYSLALLRAERQWLDTSSPAGAPHERQD